MMLSSNLLTNLEWGPRLLCELEPVNAMISAKAESLQKERNYERSCLENSRRNEVAAAAVAVGAARRGAGPIHFHDHQWRYHHHEIHWSRRCGDSAIVGRESE